ncbi:hypothetical protein Agub_g9870, partial [Astrephomene gubernaculifera]
EELKQTCLVFFPCYTSWVPVGYRCGRVALAVSLFATPYLPFLLLVRMRCQHLFSSSLLHALPIHPSLPRLQVIYERIHAELVAAVVRHRLEPGGCAVLQCAVREVKVFEYFTRECRRRGLRYRHRRVQPEEVFAPGTAAAAGAGGSGGGSNCCPFEGILGRSDEYEGGILLMALDRVDSPCQHWYRDDWEEVE